MLTLDCNNDKIYFDADINPCDAGIESASLLSYTIPVSDDKLTVGPIPQEVHDGVYPLKLNTSCGCFEARLYLHRCQPPALKAKHTPTRPDGNKIAPECCPPEQETAQDE